MNTQSESKWDKPLAMVVGIIALIVVGIVGIGFASILIGNEWPWLVASGLAIFDSKGFWFFVCFVWLMWMLRLFLIDPITSRLDDIKRFLAGIERELDDLADRLPDTDVSADLDEIKSEISELASRD